MTPLKKTVTRRSEELIRDRSKFRRLIVSIYPSGYIGIRPEKCRTEETITIKAVWEQAVKSRVAMEAKAKLQKKADKAGVSITVYARRKRR